MLVGDLDSISADGRMWAYAHDVEIDEQPVDKDATDTELALAQAAACDAATDLLLLGGAGDRLDHTLGTLVALGNRLLGRFAVDPRCCSARPCARAPPGRSRDARRCRPGIDVLGARPARRRAAASTCTAPAGRCADADLARRRRAPRHQQRDDSSCLTTIAVADGVLTVVVP